MAESPKKPKKKEESAISPTMTVSALLRKHPDAMDILIRYGFLLETLNEAKARKGMPEEQFKRMVSELNDLAKAVRLTDAAIEKVKGIMKEEGKDNHGLRIGLVAHGMGFGYEFSFDKDSAKGDTILEFKGLKVFIDAKSLEMMRGSKVDYVKTPQGEGFKVDNPNMPSSSCGSGCSGCG